MGGSGSKGGAQSLQSIDVQGFANRYQIPAADVQAVIKVFQTVSNDKPQVDVNQFLTGLALIRQAKPHLVIFSDEAARLVFALCDVNKTGKLNITDILSALSTFMVGTEEQKATLVFKSISSGGTLTETDLRKHAVHVVQFAAFLALADARKAHPAGHPRLDSLATSMKTYERQFADDVVRDAFHPWRNEPNPTKFSLERWLDAAAKFTTIKCLMSPTLCSNVWRVAYGDDGLQRCELTRMSDILSHPKGFAALFEFELREIDKWGPPRPASSLGSSHRSTLTPSGAPSSASAPLSNSSTAASAAAPLAPAVAISVDAYPHVEPRLEVVPLEVRPKGQFITVLLVTITQKRIPIECTTGMTVWELKERVQAREGIPPEQQRIVWPPAQELVNIRTLDEYNVHDGLELNLIVTLRKNT